MADRFKNVRVPGPNDNIYKDECLYSFDNPESENGLYICMSTFRGLGKDHLERHCNNNPGKNVFLHIVRKRKPIPVDANIEPTKVTKLAIGVEGGFDVNQSNRFTFEEQYSIYIHPNITIHYPDESNQLPEHVKKSADAIIAADSAFLKEERSLMNATWNGEIRRVTKHTQTLNQLKNGRKIPPNGWKCDQCDLTENLWLNLTDGSILCGRKFFDGTGGNNHAAEHYYKTKYPLAVKLGTITAKGADVYSYDEDDMVEDPNLAIHLSHWGINMLKMEKSDRSMADLEIELNQKYGEASMIEEANSKLQPVHGPGYTGMRNLGNSCYMNSVIQVLFTLKDFQEKYYQHCDFYFDKAKDPANDFNAQTAKLAFGLLSGRYSKELPSNNDISLQAPSGIRPQMFRLLIGRNHPDFGTKQQQDAAEFLQYYIEQVHNHCKKDPTPNPSLDPSTCFQFELEERIYLPETNQVRYLTRNDSMFRLSVPLSAARNMHEVLQYNKTKEDMEKQGKKLNDLPVVRPIIPLKEAISQWAAPEEIHDYKLPQYGRTTTIRKTQKFLTFPDYLFIQLKKYTFNPDWTPRKIDVSMEVPDELDLSSLRAKGVQPGEIVMVDDDEPTGPSSVSVNEVLLQQLVDMGFSMEGCKRALINTGNNDIEAAMNWVFEHQSDPDFDTPYQAPSKKARVEQTQTPPVDEESIGIVMSMGFSRAHALRALSLMNNNVEAAVDWAFNTPEDNSTLNALVESLPQSSSTQQTKQTYRDGTGKYRLVAFISHIGNHPSSGHYVAHILKDNRWVIFNDEVVAFSEHPPKDLAYLYLYKRETI
ncbi:unnamed protein product [Rotaria sp. Silwood1]|nr:unnamed protein product [Rotaria sp. Silwood1]CAF3386577.1 unnamed protein product [Rotaria sp. Silwood1]CAF3386874.1 unnamed protein product [Rotaria sp. Silwood1]CAF4584299.1 unnamed protein product [Rotaria sp. Silwood1]CAF4600114.1 unnamed protein product [Rotaria sp. Silwood1]